MPPKLYGNGCLLNNTRPIYLKRESELRLQGLIFITKQHQFFLPNQCGDQSTIN
jgi:hypothetical protein